MSRVITFSMVFPKGHPMVAKPTHFPEKIWKGFYELNGGDMRDFLWYLEQYDNHFGVDNINNVHNFQPKWHTIRAGHRWKVGDKFSPRVWSGKPYQTKQIIIGPDIEIKKIWKFEMDEEGVFYINGKYVDVTSSIHDGKTVADNDGLDSDDFMNWFGVHPKKKYKKFSGQILCWNESIKYYE